jgi:hypothetical protein
VIGSPEVSDSPEMDPESGSQNRIMIFGPKFFWPWSVAGYL